MLCTSNTLKDIPCKSNDYLEGSKKDEYLEKIQGIIDDTMPADFDTWTVQEQRNWMCQSVTKYFSNVPEGLKDYIPSVFRLIDSDRSQDKLPEWIDVDKYRRGQKFVREHYLSIIVGTLFGSIYAYTYKDGLKPIIISGNSHTPYLAFKRYSSNIFFLIMYCF